MLLIMSYNSNILVKRKKLVKESIKNLHRKYVNYHNHSKIFYIIFEFN